jgi:glycosyltransferase 2 family protein
VKNVLVSILKIVIPLAIIGWLVASVDAAQWEQLQERPVRWPLLLTAFLAAFAAVSTGFSRWFVLVRALGLPFRIRDAFRLGFLGYLFNFVSVGSVGGDLFKAVFIAREHKGQRTLAVASVVADRVVGLFGLLLLTSGALLWATLPPDSEELRLLRNLTFGFTAAGTAGLLLILLPGFTTGKISEMLSNLIAALRLYCRQPLMLALAILMSVALHALIVASIYLMAHGLYTTPPTLAEHLIIVPMANVAGALPFTPAGLGTFEVALEWLYRYASASTVPGITVALGYRLVTIVVAGVGVFVYWFSRREIQHVMHLEEPANLDNSAAEPTEQVDVPPAALKK